MGGKEYLLNQFGSLHKTEFYSKIMKLVPVSIFIVLSPVLIYGQFSSKEYLTVLFFITADIVFLILARSLFLELKAEPSFQKSKIHYCLQNPNIVNRVIISKSKVLFDISEMEDASINLRNSDYKDEIISHLRSFYGDSKIIICND